MNTALIMRGVSGSGKSTRARLLAGATGVVHSTDDYFYVNGVYRFDPAKFAQYHRRNLEAFRASLAAGVPIVICDNTNTRRWEFAPYVKAAEDAGYLITVVSLPHPDVAVAAARNTHGVPAEMIKRMIDRWED
jgi:tRNA uridine 5-carbamoylmethylation protein Kti12